MPPVELYFSNEVFESTIPVMFIVPGEGHFAAGLDLFTFSSLMDASYIQSGFREKMKTDFDLAIPPTISAIPIAFTPDSIPGIQLSNEYGASFLQNLTEVAAPTLGQIAQITGAGKGVKEFVTTLPGMLGGALGETGKKYGEKFGAMAGAALGHIEDLAAKGIGKAGGTGAERFAHSAGEIVGAMLMGARVDFPKVWLGSSFSGPVSITVRLYNPNQASELSYFTRIINPLKILLALAAPLSSKDNIYTWPYIHQIYCHGLFFWKMAAIIGMNVQPAPENQMSWNQRPSMVDVRIDFIPLHQIMLNRRTSNVPNVGDWINQLTKKREAPHLWREPAGSPIPSRLPSVVYDDSVWVETVSKPTPTTTPDLTGPPRVEEVDVATYNKILEEQRAKGINPSADRLARERAAIVEAKFEEDSLRKAQEGEISEEAARQFEYQQALKDQEIQDNLAYGFNQAGINGPDYQPGPNMSESLNQTTVGNIMDGIVPGTQEEWNQAELASAEAQGQEPGKVTSIFQGISSKLSETGSKVYSDLKSTVTGLIDGASDKARKVSEDVKRATGTDKKTGEDIKSTVATTTPTINEERLAEVIPTTTEADKKAVTEPTVVASQEKMQAMTSEVAIENQEYNRKMSILTNLLQRTTDPATKTFAEKQITNLNGNHLLNLQSIENKYST
jgi:hypothetical protein